MDNEVLEAPAVFWVYLSSDDDNLVVTDVPAAVLIKDGDGSYTTLIFGSSSHLHFVLPLQAP